ncbi:MAG: hypothetical protein ABEJ74_08435 [Haloferacaceae archaeon]
MAGNTRAPTGTTPTATTSESLKDGAPSCPFCGSEEVRRELAFGSALSKSQYSCTNCDTVFERIRWEARRPTSAADR